MVYLVLIVVAFIASLISGAAGFGGSSLLSPVLTLSLGAELAVPVLTISMFFSNVSRAILGFKKIAWKPVLIFMATSVPLSALGAFSFSILPKDIVTRIIGLSLIIFVSIKFIKRKEFIANNKTVLIGGCVVGLLSGLVGTAGPISAVVFLALGLPPVGYVASEALTATVNNIVKMVIYETVLNLPYEVWLIGILMGIVMVFGSIIAKKYIEKIEYNKFQRAVSMLLIVMGAYMIITG